MTQNVLTSKVQGSFRSAFAAAAFALLTGLAGIPAQAGAPAGYSFGVLPVRAPAATAQYWNPILAYVSHKTGVPLELKVARTGAESSAATLRGDYDIIWGNHQFKPAAVEEGYRAIAGPRGAGITAEIVVRSDSPMRTLADVDKGVMGFPHSAAFVGYLVPMDHLVRNKLQVTPVYGGNQEGIMAQLKAGTVPAAGVNSKVMAAFASREGLGYRVLWKSPAYLDFPISVHPRVPAKVAKAVQQILAGMAEDPEGAAILAASAGSIQQRPPYGFVAVEQRDYQSYLEFFRSTVLKDVE